jgi:hypothetical protein
MRAESPEGRLNQRRRVRMKIVEYRMHDDIDTGLFSPGSSTGRLLPESMVQCPLDGVGRAVATTFPFNGTARILPIMAQSSAAALHAKNLPPAVSATDVQYQWAKTVTVPGFGSLGSV